MRSIFIFAFLSAIVVRGQQWVQAPDFAGTERDDAAWFGYDCYAYVGTGMESGWSLTNDWWRFDALNEIWEAVNPLPASPRQYCASHTTTEGGFLFGGVDATGPLNELWFFSFVTGDWSQRASLPAQGRYASSAFGSYNELFVVAGLLADGSATNELWEYDIQGDQWIQRMSLPGVGRHRAAAATSSTHMYLFGGADAAYLPLDEAWAYDRNVDTWEELDPMPEGRYSGSAISMGQALVFLCGVDATGTLRSDGFLYVSGSDTWVPWTDFVAPRRSGILAKVLPCSGFPCYYYGLGYDGNARHNDWYKLCPGNGLEESLSRALAVGPNPASTTLNIAYPVSALNAELNIRDEAGRVVRTISGKPSAIDISDLASGAYTISVLCSQTQYRSTFIKLP